MASKVSLGKEPFQTPYLTVKGAPRLIEFLKEAFAAQEIHRQALPDGNIINAQIQVGDVLVMVSEALSEVQPTPSRLYVRVPDTDIIHQRALKAGGTSLLEPTDSVYGERNAGVQDPAGNLWWIAAHGRDHSMGLKKEDV